MVGGARPRAKGGSDSSQKADQGQNIQVCARVRPISAQERAGRTFSVVETQGHKEVVMRAHNHGHSRTFQFDRVFDAKSEQLQVYGSVVEPLLEQVGPCFGSLCRWTFSQVMMGYNCTVFAYGQTGSGKTFTMEGDMPVSGEWQTWDSHPTAGVIPRCLGQIFDKLRMAEETEGAESSVRVSFLELYNEEIFDLLSSAEDMPKLRIFDDPLQPGSVIIKVTFLVGGLINKIDLRTLVRTWRR
jgi:kinesin family protein 11